MFVYFWLKGPVYLEGFKKILYLLMLKISSIQFEDYALGSNGSQVIRYISRRDLVEHQILHESEKNNMVYLTKLEPSRHQEAKEVSKHTPVGLLCGWSEGRMQPGLSPGGELGHRVGKT